MGLLVRVARHTRRVAPPSAPDTPGFGWGFRVFWYGGLIEGPRRCERPGPWQPPDRVIAWRL